MSRPVRTTKVPARHQDSVPAAPAVQIPHVPPPAEDSAPSLAAFQQHQQQQAEAAIAANALGADVEASAEVAADVAAHNIATAMQEDAFNESPVEVEGEEDDTPTPTLDRGLLSEEDSTTLEGFTKCHPCKSGKNGMTVKDLKQELTIRGVTGANLKEKGKGKDKEALAKMVLELRRVQDGCVDLEPVAAKQHQWTDNDWARLCECICNPTVAASVAAELQHHTRADFEHLSDQDSFLVAVEKVFNNKFESFNSKIITDKDTMMRGMDANKAQLPTEDWEGWPGVKLVEKWKAARAPLSVTKSQVEKTGENNPDNIPRHSHGSNGVPAKAIWYACSECHWQRNRGGSE